MELIKLNELFKTSKFEIPPTAELTPDLAQKWLPDSLSHITYLPSYSKVSEALRLRYNQLHALCINEMFIWFELEMVLPVMKKLVKDNGHDPVFQEACQSFHDDEVRHSDLFRKLNRTAAPQFYQGNDYYFLNQYGQLSKKLLELTFKFPFVVSSWCWVAIILEERTLMTSKEYLKAKDQVSPAFAKAHILHMIDEVRHVEMDEYIIDRLYKNRSTVSKWIANHLVESFLKSFQNPRFTPLAIANQLKKEFTSAEDHAMIDLIIADIPTLKDNYHYQKQIYGLGATKETQKLLVHYPELASLNRYFISEK